jgi:site-specific DNA recombinase
MQNCASNPHKNTPGETVAMGETSMKTAAAYIRVSTDDQLEYSPDSQLEKIREYAAANNMILPEKYIFREEEGISGKKAERRPEFMRMIGTAKQKPKPFDAIIVWKFSRFARNREDSIVYKSMLRKQYGIDVLSVTEQLGDDKMSIIVEAMIEAMDEYYSINLAEEVRRGMNEKVMRGEPVSIPPFGYTIQEKAIQNRPRCRSDCQNDFSGLHCGDGVPLHRAKAQCHGSAHPARRAVGKPHRGIYPEESRLHRENTLEPEAKDSTELQ